jgi:hypothetical protein
VRYYKRVLAAVVALALPIIGATNVAQADTCDVQCQLELQRQNALPRTAFYEPPNPLRWAPAGALIRQQATTAYRVEGASVPATRILYHSRTSKGRDVAASGVVLVPQGKAPVGGWPVVVDAHGSSGIGRDCAPSLMRDLYHGNQMLRFVERGFAVVAPDYAGLRTDGRHELVNKTAESSDVIYAQRAARQALPDLSRRWVLWGHSQGGGAALGVAERQWLVPQPGYLGAVVTSPASDLSSLAAHVATTPGYGAFAALLADGAHNSDPRIRPDRLLTPEAFSRSGITAVGCLGARPGALAAGRSRHCHSPSSQRQGCGVAVQSRGASGVPHLSRPRTRHLPLGPRHRRWRHARHPHLDRPPLRRPADHHHLQSQTDPHHAFTSSAQTRSPEPVPPDRIWSAADRPPTVSPARADRRTSTTSCRSVRRRPVIGQLCRWGLGGFGGDGDCGSQVA